MCGRTLSLRFEKMLCLMSDGKLKNEHRVVHQHAFHLSVVKSLIVAFKLTEEYYILEY